MTWAVLCQLHHSIQTGTMSIHPLAAMGLEQPADLSDLRRGDYGCKRQTVANALCHGHDVRHDALQVMHQREVVSPQQHRELADCGSRHTMPSEAPVKSSDIENDMYNFAPTSVASAILQRAWVWKPQKWLPVRPKPVCTSSAMFRPPASVTICGA